MRSECDIPVAKSENIQRHAFHFIVENFVSTVFIAVLNVTVLAIFLSTNILVFDFVYFSSIWTQTCQIIGKIVIFRTFSIFDAELSNKVFGSIGTRISCVESTLIATETWAQP